MARPTTIPTPCSSTPRSSAIAGAPPEHVTAYLHEWVAWISEALSRAERIGVTTCRGDGIGPPDDLLQPCATYFRREWLKEWRSTLEKHFIGIQREQSNRPPPRVMDADLQWPEFPCALKAYRVAVLQQARNDQEQSAIDQWLNRLTSLVDESVMYPATYQELTLIRAQMEEYILAGSNLPNWDDWEMEAKAVLDLVGKKHPGTYRDHGELVSGMANSDTRKELPVRGEAGGGYCWGRGGLQFLKRIGLIKKQRITIAATPLGLLVWQRHRRQLARATAPAHEMVRYR